MNGLDLFSGIGGISIALKPWVRTVAYCERDRYAQAVLLSRMLSGELDRAPIWDDIASLRGAMLPSIDIIFGGFPCQDISVAGLGRGLDGERSGLFFEIMRLAEETQPKFIFLENVPAIRTRGASRVGKELADRGYDCRWTTLSAQEVGANHKRERWFLLAANTDSIGLRDWWQRNKEGQAKADLQSRNNGEKESLADAISILSKEDGARQSHSPSWWESEPNVGRVVNGLPLRVDRLRCLGNAVVPLQAREAFKELLTRRYRGLNETVAMD